MIAGARRRLLAGLLLVAACGDSGGDSSGEATASDSSAATGDASEATAVGDASEGSVGAVGECRAVCDAPEDCCAPGVPGCPGDYPNAWSCDDGLCVAQGCELDEHCSLGGTLPDFECHPITGVGTCFTPCAGDSDCVQIPGSSCDGLADDGARYCRAGCREDAECLGLGRCMADGTCRCDAAADCVGEHEYACVAP